MVISCGGGDNGSSSGTDSGGGDTGSNPIPDATIDSGADTSAPETGGGDTSTGGDSSAPMDATGGDAPSTTDGSGETDGAPPSNDASTDAPGGGGDASDGATPADAAPDASGGLGPGNANCMMATTVQLSAANSEIDLPADTTGGRHSINAPCTADNGAEVFYQFTISAALFVYADTFGASWNTVLYLLSNSCMPLTTTTMGDAVCNDDGCGAQQSQIVALLNPGRYKIGVSGRGSAQGAATVHLQWALAPSGTSKPLPEGMTTQTGATSGRTSNIGDISTSCLADGPENSYWWTNCPSDLGGMLSASTCDGQSWESVLELQVPKAISYTCNVDGCGGANGTRASLTASVPAGAGLRVLSVDGYSGTDLGNYTMTVDRP